MEQEQQTPGQRALELIRLLLPIWQPTTQGVLSWIRLALAVGLVLLGVLLILDVVSSIFDIKLWKLLRALALPITIGAAVPWLNWLQKKREQDVEDQRAQDGALQAYLDQLTQLLVIQRDHELRRLRVNEDVRQVIQARSEPLLRSLNPTRRWSLILFLSVMGLLAKERPLVSLAGAVLSSVDGRGAPLQGVDLEGANLSGAHLEMANLSRANLGGANLSGAYLNGAFLSRAVLRAADLRHANLRAADLRGANLRDANLEGTMLRGANLSFADLEGTNFRGANLRAANLSHARGANVEDTYRRDTIMPNGEIAEPSPLL